MDMQKLPYVNIEGLEKCLNRGVSQDEPVIIQASQTRETYPREFTTIDLWEYPLKREFCVECPIMQDQHRFFWLTPFKEIVDDTPVGYVYAEKGCIDNGTIYGADFVNIQLNLKKPRKLQGRATEPRNRIIEMHIVDYHEEGRGLSVRRRDYIPGLFFDREKQVREIDTSQVVPGFKA